jgi:hypothetical protein
MDAYVFRGALYCEACGRGIAEELAARGGEDTGDSDDFPQGPCPDGGGEADTPQHCDDGPDCIEAEELDGARVGAFLENPLTRDGYAYVAAAAEREPANPVVRMWLEFYGLEVPEGS